MNHVRQQNEDQPWQSGPSRGMRPGRRPHVDWHDPVALEERLDVVEVARRPDLNSDTLERVVPETLFLEVGPDFEPFFRVVRLVSDIVAIE